MAILMISSSGNGVLDLLGEHDIAAAWAAWQPFRNI
jgi:hypothetical protein